MEIQAPGIITTITLVTHLVQVGVGRHRLGLVEEGNVRRSAVFIGGLIMGILRLRCRWDRVLTWIGHACMPGLLG